MKSSQIATYSRPVAVWQRVKTQPKEQTGSADWPLPFQKTKSFSQHSEMTWTPHPPPMDLHVSSIWVCGAERWEIYPFFNLSILHFTENYKPGSISRADKRPNASPPEVCDTMMYVHFYLRGLKIYIARVNRMENASERLRDLKWIFIAHSFEFLVSFAALSLFSHGCYRFFWKMVITTIGGESGVCNKMPNNPSSLMWSFHSAFGLTALAFV